MVEPFVYFQVVCCISYRGVGDMICFFSSKFSGLKVSSVCLKAIINSDPSTWEPTLNPNFDEQNILILSHQLWVWPSVSIVNITWSEQEQCWNNTSTVETYKV